MPEVDGGPVTAATWAAARQERSFEDFYAASASRLVTQLYLVTGDQEEARDCAQEAFARAWLRWGTLGAEAVNPFGWVRGPGVRAGRTDARTPGDLCG